MITLKIAAILASALSALGGIWILTHANWQGSGDSLGIGIGFYLVAKAFFLGPVLWLMAARKNEGP